MSIAADAIAEMSACDWLFLSDIQELDGNGLRLVISEGRPAGHVETIRVGDSSIPGGTRIDVTAESRVFELVWNRYVAYAVLNESYANVDDEERFEGNRFRVYSKSHFIDYLTRASFACADYPGPTQHFAVVCESHVINVISTAVPRAQVLHHPSAKV